MQQNQTRRSSTNSLLANVIKGALAGAIAVYVIDRMERMADRELDAWPESTDAFGLADESVPRPAAGTGRQHLLGLGVSLIKNGGLNAFTDFYTKAHQRRPQSLERL